MANLKIKEMSIQLANQMVLEHLDLELNAAEIIGVVTTNQLRHAHFFNHFTRHFPESKVTAQRPTFPKRIFFTADCNHLKINLTPLELLNCMEINSKSYRRLQKFLAAAPSQQPSLKQPNTASETFNLRINGFFVSETPILTLQQNLQGTSQSSVKEIIASFSHSKDRSKIFFMPAKANDPQVISKRTLHLKKQRRLETASAVPHQISAQTYHAIYT
ncbi:hypothetical protein [Enterococcus sp. HY326]|uniref:hypothetical protein n=1 Tax=Enterococcus sp. HY326 TaxID=2971265 RepID=UPI0022401A18|nr:hypothetical protein [Enterococcus sp. HY326]